MKRDHLGDAYDAVKRLWQDLFKQWAPLYANPRFIPHELQHDFTKFTHIPLLKGDELAPYSLFNDPDTGIRLPDRDNQSESRIHISLRTIRNQLDNELVRCVITYDQTNHRESGNPREKQRASKREWLTQQGISSFYYVSQVPFLFAFRGKEHFDTALKLLASAGIPDDRIER